MESKIKKELGAFERFYDFLLPPASIVLCFIIEVLMRHSIVGAVHFVTTNPVAFVFGCVFIYATGRIAAFFPHRRFVTVLIWLVWLGLGVTGFVVGFFRVMPFSAMDIALLPGIWTIFRNYLNVFVMALIFLALILCLAALVFAAVRSSRCRVNFPRSAVLFVVSLAVSACVCFAGFGTGALSLKLDSLTTGYENYGFVYTFGFSIFDRGISEPENYSPETLDEIADILEEEAPMPLSADGLKTPNIVFLQLESFFDPDHVKGLVLNQNPLSNFSRLRSQCPSGYLRVPVMGSGTVNTEFEVITGMNIDYFGVGEYPYETVLQANTCESVCYNLRAYGYTSHAIHDNSASFYKRDVVFSMLGFDTFTPLEYMADVEYNPIEWADDSILTDYVVNAIKSTNGPDMVYTISVQPHGKYPTEYDDTWKPTIRVTGAAEDMTPSWEYYAEQLRQEDEFVGEILTAIEKLGEDTVVVIYGDHLPNLGLESADIEYGSIYRTEYVIWSNFPIKAKQHRDLDAYQLTAYIQSLLGMSSGEITVLHQELSSDPDYQNYLENIEYDILYGDKILYDGENPYEPTILQYGTKNICIDSLTRNEGSQYTVTGHGFNTFSTVLVNGRERDTEYIDSSTLTFRHNGDISSLDTITVAQINEAGDELGRCEPFIPE